MALSPIEGRLVTGLGRAADFTSIDWVRRQLIELAGIDPHPGTVNLGLPGEHQRSLWRDWRTLPGHPIEPGDPAYCRSRCFPVSIAGRIPGAIVLPEVQGYPEDKVELVAALPVRAHLALAEGAAVAVRLCEPFAAKAVLFDLDGTLVDSMGAYLEVARVAAEPHGIQVTARHVHHALATGASFWDGVVPPERPGAKALRKELFERAAREWPRILREHCRLFDGIAGVLDGLRASGVALGIMSGARPEVLDLLKAEGLLERFDAVVMGPDVSRRKPHPEGILKCLGMLGVTPERAAYVGDTPLDLQASRAAGVHAIGVLTGAGDSATLSAHRPDRLVATLARLPAVIQPA